MKTKYMTIIGVVVLIIVIVIFLGVFLFKKPAETFTPKWKKSTTVASEPNIPPIDTIDRGGMSSIDRGGVTSIGIGASQGISSITPLPINQTIDRTELTPLPSDFSTGMSPIDDTPQPIDNDTQHAIDVEPQTQPKSIKSNKKKGQSTPSQYQTLGITYSMVQPQE